jgi:hypothetical protein
MTRAAETVVGTVQRWGGVAIPVITLPDSVTHLPSTNLGLDWVDHNLDVLGNYPKPAA